MYVERANFSGNWHVSGFPAMTAFDGFLHKLQRDIQVIDDGFYVNKWAVIVEKSDMESGKKRFSCANVLVDGDNVFNPSIVDERMGCLDVTLIVEIVSNFLPSEWNVKRKDPRVKSIFSSMRFAGGTTTIYTEPYSEKYPGRVIEFYDRFIDSIKKVNRRAFLIEDKTSKITSYSREGESKIETLARLFRRPNKILTDAQISLLDQDVPEGLYVPLAVGYRLLETPTIKPGARDLETPHAYAEPIIGLGRARTLGSVLHHLSIAESEEDILHFWTNDRIQEQESKTVLSQTHYAVVGCKS
jgi:CRISPR type I-F-associated protein Csy2